MLDGWLDGWRREGREGEGEEGGRKHGSSCLRPVEQCALKARASTQEWKPSPAPACVVKAICLCWVKEVRHKRWCSGTALAVQWLRLHASTAKGCGFNPWMGTKIPHTMWHGPKTKMGDVPFRWNGQKVRTVVLAWSLWSGVVTERRETRGTFLG